MPGKENTGQASTLITGIGELVTNDGERGGYAAITDAALVIAEGKVAWTGPASRAPAADIGALLSGSPPGAVLASLASGRS